MSEYITTLEAVFEEHHDHERALQQKAYMRNQFEFYGLTSPIRKELQKPFLQKDYLPLKEEAFDIITVLWNKPQREYQLFCLDLLDKYKRQYKEDDIAFLEKLICQKSWWDTVDFLAYKQVGALLSKYPSMQKSCSQRWLASNNIWLQRTAVLFQLKYKSDLDTNLLVDNITPLLGSKEFFINKAIGWVLREYSRTNPEWVIEYVSTEVDLSNLSKKEALRLLEK
ncbi:DNA alkylation repair protein [Flammeovirga sp. EKP202]|uniref:DNA alkylation repair protein n=1 Tax=Flammeovirga sp. EKP202 TaxID=2770592 RepID=UPI00165FE8B3|nr:DNA alkylation repair protein [Flammeovirga sp. EKP202]MBD0404652.1 DNA alkylation repair protein [Flammeovirga sp. EKP202]